MPINISVPIQVPQKTFDKYWCRQIVIHSPIPNGEAEAVVQLLPYNDAGESHSPGVIYLRVKGIMAKAAANPEGNFAKAMHFLLAAIDEEKTVQETP